MNPSREDLEWQYRQLEDEVLLDRYESGTLTELAQSVALHEMRRRGIEPPAVEVPTENAGVDGEAQRSGDMKRIARHLTWAEAQILCALLESEGIKAFAADANLSIAHVFLSVAGGGVRVLVHEADMPRALQIADAMKRGEYSIGEDHDVDAT